MKDKKIRKHFFSVRVVRNFGFNKLESYANSLRSFRHLVYCKKKRISMGVVGDCDASCASKKAYFFVSELEHFGNSRALLRSQVNNSVSQSVRPSVVASNDAKVAIYQNYVRTPPPVTSTRYTSWPAVCLVFAPWHI